MNEKQKDELLKHVVGGMTMFDNLKCKMGFHKPVQEHFSIKHKYRTTNKELIRENPKAVPPTAKRYIAIPGATSN